jgi:hypothetical protein
LGVLILLIRANHMWAMSRWLFWYHGLMLHSTRRLLACLLIMLLPFSAVAGSLTALATLARPCPHASMPKADCCKHDAKSGAQSACCAAAAAAVTATAMPAQITSARPIRAHRARATAVIEFYDSFIPDSLHPPPRRA